jgi:hypothetical protein
VRAGQAQLVRAGQAQLVRAGQAQLVRREPDSLEPARSAPRAGGATIVFGRSWRDSDFEAGVIRIRAMWDSSGYDDAAAP